jgi:hypothetical protein
MTDQIGASKPPAFYEDVVEHLRMIADYISAAGDRANATAPKDGSELLQMVTLDHLEHSMTANEDDADYSGYSVVRLDSDGAYDLTGIVAGAGRWLTLVNVSASTITLKDEATSAPANQLKLGGEFSLLAELAVVLWYDSVTTRWRRIPG